MAAAVAQRRPSTGGSRGTPSLSTPLPRPGRSKERAESGSRQSKAPVRPSSSGGKAMASSAIHRVSSTTSHSSGAQYFHPNGPPIPERRPRGERPSSASGERGRPPILGVPGDMQRPITPGPDMMRQMSVPGDMHRTHSAQDGHYRQYVSSSRASSQDPMRQSTESRSSRSGADPSFNRNQSMNDGSSQSRRSSRRSSGAGMAPVPENSKKSSPYPYPYIPGQPMPMPGQHPKMPRGMPAPYPMPGGGPRSSMPAPGQHPPMSGPGAHMPLYAQQMQVQMMMQQLQMQQHQHQHQGKNQQQHKAPVHMSSSSSSSDLQPGGHASPSPPSNVNATASSERPSGTPEADQGAAAGASQGADVPSGVPPEGIPQSQEEETAAEASQQAPGWLALPAPGDVMDPLGGADPSDPHAPAPFFGTPEEQVAAAAAAGMDPSLMGDAGALVLYNPESGEPLQDESGALVLYQPPPVEQAETISQMLIVIQHLQGEVQSLRWALEQMREQVDSKGVGGEGKEAVSLPEGSAEEIRTLLLNRDMQQRARLHNAGSMREKDPLERLPNDKGDLPKKFPHFRRDVVCMPSEIVSYLIEFYDLPRDPFETRLDRVAKFIGIRLA